MNPDIEKISSFINSQLLHSSPESVVDPDQLLLEDGILDSLGLQELLIYIESEFSIAVVDDELTPENFESVRAIANLIERLRVPTASHT